MEEGEGGGERGEGREGREEVEALTRSFLVQYQRMRCAQIIIASAFRGYYVSVCMPVPAPPPHGMAWSACLPA